MIPAVSYPGSSAKSNVPFSLLPFGKITEGNDQQWYKQLEEFFLWVFGENVIYGTTSKWFTDTS